MFQFCYVKGRYPKKLATYEKMASFIYRESRQEVEIDAAGAANVTKQLRNNADVNETDVLNEWTGLMYASSKGRTKTVQALLSASPDWVDVNATGNTLRRSTALMLAAEGENI
jgi:ankyrin repeat protein